MNTTRICAAYASVAAVLLGIVGMSFHGCQRANVAFYEAMHDCVSHGGTWINHAEYKADCVRPDK